MCKIIEVTGDLFSATGEWSLAHCVAADMRLGKGIAVKFRDKFNQIDILKSQGIKPGGVAILKDSERFIYYLVTKELSYQKPTYKLLSQSLEAMRDHMRENKVTKLAIPRIGCGLDGLVWNKVHDVLEEVFHKESNCEIKVYNFTATS